MTRLHFLIVLFLTGCAAALPVITEKEFKNISNRWPGTPLQSLNDGRRLYIDKCAGCHSLHVPSELTDEEWAKTMDKMQRKAKLTDTEKELVLKYILSAKME